MLPEQRDSMCPTLFFEEVLEAGEHHAPVLCRVVALFFGGVVVLGERDNRACSVGSQGYGHCMVVLGKVRLVGKRAEVAVLKFTPLPQLEDGAFVLVGLALPLALPDYGRAFFPLGDGIRADHVLLYTFG